MGDLEYLRAHSKEASHLALIDSASRATSLWPTASRFEVVFDTPYQNVYGIDLLGVNVPRTEYNISGSRNVLRFSFGSGQKHTVTVVEGDYDANTVLSALNTALAAFVSAAGNTLSARPLPPSVNVTNRIMLACAEPFTVYLSESSARVVLGFGDPVSPDTPFYSAPGWKAGAPDVASSVLAANTGTAALVAYQGPAPSVAHAITSSTPFSQDFVSTYGGVCVSLEVVFGSQGSPPSSSLSWQVTNGAGVVASGLVQPDTDSPTTLSVGTVAAAPQALVAGQAYTLTVSDPINGDSTNCYTAFSGPAVDGATGLRTGGSTVAGSLAATLSCRPAESVIVAPGLLDLTGERYIVLRCLEVEAAINGSRAFEQFNAGVGMIQLGTYGYSNQSYDYSAYPARTFQPISNLFKLSLSFQKPNGQLYDFKGLNVQVLLLIRYLAPDRTAALTRTHPHYTPSLAVAQSRLLASEVENDPRYSWCSSRR